MAKRFHRQIGKLGSRSADEASVAMIIKEFEDTDLAITKFLESSKTLRDAWKNILLTEANLADSWWTLYQTIPRTSESRQPPEETPQDVLDRVKELGTVYKGLQEDMMEEVRKMDTLLIQPLQECAQALKQIKKAMVSRDNKKLDFERFTRNAESARAKANKSESQYSALNRAEADLEKATTAYEIADDYFKNFVPPILHKLGEFMPFLLEITAQIQFTLFQHCYSDYHHFAETYGYPEQQEEDVIVAEWESAFLGLQNEIETGFKMIAHGKARHVPMNTLGRDSGPMSKLPSVPSFGRGGGGAKKLPPPPPPPQGGDDHSDRFSIGRKKSSQSLSTARSIRSRNSSKTLHEDYQSREESPPPLPGPRPTTGHSNGSSSYGDRLKEHDNNEDYRPPSSYRSNSSTYGGNSVGHGHGTGYVAPTPLAGLRPSALKGSSTPSLPTYTDSRSPNTSASLSMRNGTPSINVQDSRAPGVQANVPIKSVVSAARTYNGYNNNNNNNSSSSHGLEIPTLRSTGRRTSDSAVDVSRSPSESSYLSSSKSPSSTGKIRSPSYSSATSAVSSFASAAAAKKKPPPPPPKKKHLGAKETWVKAIYDFEGQAHGDLSFREGERIRVTKKTESVDDWWEGELEDKRAKGAFPANYVELEK